eukprot:3453425-Rhodomonas_salina.1
MKGGRSPVIAHWRVALWLAGRDTLSPPRSQRRGCGSANAWWKTDAGCRLSSPPVSVSSDPCQWIPVSPHFPIVFLCPQAVEGLQECETVEGDVVAA